MTDIAGNQKKLIDPSAGTINYTYNGFGELTTQISPGPKTTTILYLADGRISQKNITEGTTKYRYNTNKQVINTSSPGNVSRSISYDSKGRVSTVTDTIPGSAPFITLHEYDNLGRKSTITHPSGIIETYNYNSNGYLSSVSAGGSVWWTINSLNARQQVTSGQYGNNLSATFGFNNYGFPTSTVVGSIQDYSYNFNPLTGNLNWRQNNKYSNLREDFQYDNLDRLTNVQMDTTTLQMTYDGNTGGISTKSDIGTFNYETSLKPYAISSIDPSSGIVPADTQTITYTSFESISSITEKNYAANFIYNSDNQRARMVVQQNGNSILMRWYPNGGYIKENDGSVNKEYTFIGGDAYSAPVVAITQSGTTIYYYLLRDHVGSITHIVNSSSNELIAEYSYDAWGRMRNPLTWVNYSPDSVPSLMIASRGFTGHEQLPWFNLINMNGRVYDPLTAMFLSPDNYVQSPSLTQNFNRYGYCLNNPLRYTDPTGYFRSAIDWNSQNGSQGATFYNNYPGNWSGYQQFLSNHNSLPGYHYDWEKGVYVNEKGREVSFAEVNNNLIQPNSSHADLISLGLGKPSISVITYDTPDFYSPYSLGRSEVIILVFGKMFSEYNMVQTAYYENRPPILDKGWDWNNGFYYDDRELELYSDPWYRRGSDFYFEDRPNAYKFKGEITLYGKGKSGWEVIQNMSWGYSIKPDGVNHFFEPFYNPSQDHQSNLQRTLDYWNNH